LVQKPSVAIVGTRNVSAEGAARARRLARELAGAGVVVSGLVRGVDMYKPIRGSPGALRVFLGTALHVSTAPFDCVRALLACAGLCSAHRESDTARSTSREPDNSYGDASVRRIGPI
jgi:hypothetical protein